LTLTVCSCHFNVHNKEIRNRGTRKILVKLTSRLFQTNHGFQGQASKALKIVNFSFHEYFASFRTSEIAESFWESGFIAFPKPYFLAFTSISRVFWPRNYRIVLGVRFHSLPKTGQFRVVQLTWKILVLQCLTGKYSASKIFSPKAMGENSQNFLGKFVRFFVTLRYFYGVVIHIK